MNDTKKQEKPYTISGVVLTSKAESLHETLANCHPSIARGKVWCRTCGREKKVNPAESMRTGWAKCCGYTMTIDHPDTW